jgi:Swt1-like HEPN
MVMTNRDRVDRGLGHLARGLGPFVNKQMAAAFPGGKDWMKILAARNPSPYGTGQRYSLSDPRFLLRVITQEWRVFKDQLSRVEQGFATELRDTGNRWAHGDPFSADDTYRALDTMERLLTAIGAAEQASEVRGLRLGLQQPAPRASTPPADTSAARHGPPAVQRSARTSGFWSQVAAEDVVRAIREYDRLGQEQFLAEYGFGRATAYLLIYRGRSYDSKAILGVAYKFATGVRIGAHDFSGGVHGAAGVLRRLGFEVRDARNPAGQQAEDRAGPGGPVRPPGPAPTPARAVPQPSASSLGEVDPQRSLLVLTCSARKDSGGRPPGPDDAVAWPQDLRDARIRVLATARADTAHVLPAWRRYTGTFYQHAQPALADAVAAGHVVIISGGYGIARSDEPIGWYDKILHLADWPAGLLESALIGEARRCDAQTVVAFASTTTDYTKLLQRTRWQQAGIDARLVTITGVTGGAMSEVPRRLGQAFSAFWNRQHSSYPPGTTVEPLR